jgi:DNA polymerase-3 subunit delta
MGDKIDKARIKPVYYIYGPEDYLAERHLASIKSAVLQPGFESLNYQVYYRDSMDAAEVVAGAETLPAFSEKRVVVVKKAESLNESQRKLFYEYVKDPSESTVLVFMAGTKKPDMRSSFVKLLSELGYLLEFKRLRGSELVGWIKKETKGLGKAISDRAAQRLMESAGPRLRDILGELEKIALFIGDKHEIEGTDVEDAGLDCREETIYRLSDAIGSKDLSEAMRIYSRISNEQPLKILSAISREVRVLLKIKVAGKKAVPQGLARLVGVPPWTLDAYMKRSALFTEEELKTAIRRFHSVDLALKSGRMPQSIAMTRLIIDLCGTA